jgi:GTP-binding protein HflX
MKNVIRMDFYRLFHSRPIKVGMIASFFVAIAGMLFSLGVIEIMKMALGSDPEAAEKADVTLKTLADLGAAEIPVVTVLNKCDKLEENIPENDSTVKISALKAQGIDRLLECIARNLPETAKRMKLLLPYAKGGLTAVIRENGKVFSEEYTENGILVDALVDKMNIKQMTEYEVE